MNTCADLMTKDPVSCLPSDSAHKIATLMERQDVGSIPVIEDQKGGQLLGIVTDRDLALKVIGEGRNPDTTTIEEIMTRDPVACSSKDKIQKAYDLMMKHRVRRIPVINAEKQLVGIISQADVAMRVGKHQKTGEMVAALSKSTTGRN